MKTKNFAYGLAALVAPLILAACASAPATKEAADTSAEASDSVKVSTDLAAPLERRATDRWKLLIAKDGARAYTYLTPGYRAKKPEKEYIDWVLARPVNWVSAAYQQHTCDTKESCKVSMFLGVETSIRGVPGMQQAFAEVSERWLQIDGVWYYLPEDA